VPLIEHLEVRVEALEQSNVPRDEVICELLGIIKEMRGTQRNLMRAIEANTKSLERLGRRLAK
jgi:hypothetical protein